jgi:hypothetical protein
MPEMPKENTVLLNKSYSRESWNDFPEKQQGKNHRVPGNSGTGNPGNETLLKGFCSKTKA